MTISYLLAPEPKWYFVDNFGRPLGAGYMATYNNLQRTTLQVVYQDPFGQNPWPYVSIPNTGQIGILLDENGTQGPFYWLVDTANPQNTYYVEVFDSNGNLIWTIGDFIPPSGGGGGGGTVAIDLDNLVTNNVMYRNIGATSNPINATLVKLSPGAHNGFSNNVLNASNGKYYGPDIYFVKNTVDASDIITFKKFSADGSSLTGDVTPVDYFNYTCTGPGSETIKYIQFPITQNTYNLNNQAVTFSIWARVNNAPSATITAKFVQFFGDGGSPTADNVAVIQNLAAAPIWQQFVIPTTVPALPNPLTIGSCGNDGLFLQIAIPTATALNIDFTKPSIYLGNIAPSSDYQTYDMIDTVLDSPRTGDIKVTLDNSWLSKNNVCPFGWVFMNDGTIGSASSGATARAGLDTFPLYNLIWNNVNRTWAPVVGSSTGTAIGDFAANLPLYLTRALGRVFAGTLNSEISSLVTYTTSPGQTTMTLTTPSTSFITGVPIQLTGSTLASPFLPGITYYVIVVNSTQIMLATTLANAVAGSPITFDGSTSVGAQTIHLTPYALGQTVGEENHTLTVNEMPAHTHHTLSSGSGSFNETAGIGPVKNSPNDIGTSSTTGGSMPHNNLQPTTYMNVYIKL